MTNTPNANTVSVAEHSIALLLALRRNIVDADRANQSGTPASNVALTGQELRGSNLGLIGMGRIAREVGRIAREGFGMHISAYDPGLNEEQIRQRGARPVSLGILLAEADSLSLHVPLLPQTRNLLGAQQFGSMKAGAVVVNTSRGGIIDEDALLGSLAAGHLGGAALDVTATEPLPAGHPLLSQPNVIVTPHIGGQTKQSLDRVATEAAGYISQVLSGDGVPKSAVNAPQLS